MNKSKRIIIATLSGVLFGFVCFGLASSGPSPLPWPVAVQIILSRTLIGFAIGISATSFGHWSVNGLIFGLIFSPPSDRSHLFVSHMLPFLLFNLNCCSFVPLNKLTG